MPKDILHLTVKKKWFDMTVSGEKKEEYRKIKPYWIKRLMRRRPDASLSLKRFDRVIIKNGYSKTAPTITIECRGIEIGKAKPEWSDNWQGSVFKIKLGEIITTN